MSARGWLVGWTASLTLSVICVDRINRGDSVQPLIFIPLQFRASGDTLCMHIPSPTLLILLLILFFQMLMQTETASTHGVLHKLESQKTQADRREYAHSLKRKTHFYQLMLPSRSLHLRPHSPMVRDHSFLCWLPLWWHPPTPHPPPSQGPHRVFDLKKQAFCFLSCETRSIREGKPTDNCENGSGVLMGRLCGGGSYAPKMDLWLCTIRPH